MLKRQRGDWLAVLITAADTGERHDRTDIRTPARQLRRLGGDIERLALDTNCRTHPRNLALRHQRCHA
jgi:hypothetical protein